MPTDGQRLVIRPHTPRRRALTVAAGVLLLVLVVLAAFEWGSRRAGYSALAAALERRALGEQVADLGVRLRDAEGRLAAEKLARRVDGESAAQMEKSLADLEGRLAEQTKELAFYRGIVNPSEGLAGLRVERVQVLPGSVAHHFRIRLVVMQAGRQDAVTTATADLTVDGIRAGHPASLPLAEIATGSRVLSFSFRYFQEVEAEIQLPADFQPRQVQVEVRPARASAPVRETHPWKVETG